MKNYLDALVAIDVDESSQFKATHIKYKCLDLNLWDPNLIVPEDYQLENKKNDLLILHSYFDEDRGENKKYKRLTSYAKSN